MLELRNVSSGYGAISALKGIHLRIDRGEIVTLIGANGAGKSTTLRNITGLVPTTEGEILFEGKMLNGAPAHRIAAMGISMVPEGRAIFANLTVLENLEMGAYLQTNRAENAKSLERVYALFPRLKERRKQAGGTLSGGEQQMLAIGRGLMAQPRLLMLDEPSLGLAPRVVAELFACIRRIHAERVTILLVEQNVHQALDIADRAYVLDNGRTVRSGTAAELLADDAIQAAYLGL
jgi:branched-chain amino acid transport system ATP-binding protein